MSAKCGRWGFEIVNFGLKTNRLTLPEICTPSLQWTAVEA